MRRTCQLLAAVVTMALVMASGGPALAADDGRPARAPVGTSARPCGWGKVCVTFGTAATRRIDGAAADGVMVFAGVLCGEVPIRPRPLIVVKAACAGVAAGYYSALRPVFARAAELDRRVEIGWRFVLTTLPTSWRVV